MKNFYTCLCCNETKFKMSISSFKVILLTLSISSMVLCVNIKVNTKNNSKFVPTKEWQKVEKGTSIPPGLHVRHNLQTGETEAKLLAEENEDELKEEKEKKGDMILHPEESVIDEEPKNEENKASIPLDELKSMLKSIKSDDNEFAEDISKERAEEIKKKFRSYSELKKELESLNLNVSTDSEIMKTLFEEFQEYKDSVASENLEQSKIEDILEILENIEYLIHHVDNAKVFADMNGMSFIISPCLNVSDTKIKVEALKILGAAVQSNPKVQLKALENDFVQRLLHLFTTNSKVEVKSRCMFALGALVRGFPVAQRALVNHGGLEIFGKSLINDPIQIQMRVMTLISDLAVERRNLQEIEDREKRHRRKIEYSSTRFDEKLLSQNYCESLVDLAIRTTKSDVDIDEDFYKTVYQNIIMVSPICQSKIVERRDELLPQVEEMLATHQNFHEPESSSDSELSLLDIIQMLKHILTDILRETNDHDEL